MCRKWWIRRERFGREGREKNLKGGKDVFFLFFFFDDYLIFFFFFFSQLPKDINWHFIGTLQRNKVQFPSPFLFLSPSIISPFPPLPFPSPLPHPPPPPSPPKVRILLKGVPNLALMETVTSTPSLFFASSFLTPPLPPR